MRSIPLTVPVLKRLKGIGPVLASRIVKYRGLLGGYYSVDQLTEVYGISDSLFYTIREHVCIDTSLVRKISINEAGEAQLSMHPYIGRYRAKAILSYRKSVGTISGIEELVKNKIIPEENKKRLKPTCDFRPGNEISVEPHLSGRQGVNSESCLPQS